MNVPRMPPSPTIRRTHAAFTWVFTALSVLFVAGIHVDGWAHRSFGDDLGTFLTPWHAIMYGGFALLAFFLAMTAVRNRMAGASRDAWLPSGYVLSFVGMVTFLLGGISDAIWHTILGIETGVDTLFSPTHLILAVGAMLMVTGPLRAFHRNGIPEHRLGAWIPALLASALALSVLTFMTQYVQPSVNPYASVEYQPDERVVSGFDAIGYALPEFPGEPFDGRQGAVERDHVSVRYYRQAVGAAGILWYAALISGVILPFTRRWRLPFGSAAVILGVNALFLAGLSERYVFPIGAIAAGLLVDLLGSWFRHSWRSPRFAALFAFMLPAIWTAMYFAVVFATGGTWWSVHFWTGAIMMAGIVGLLMSHFMGWERTAIE